jgi:hypothetical protein
MSSPKPALSPALNLDDITATVASPEPGFIIVDLAGARPRDLAMVVSDVLTFVVAFVYQHDGSITGTAGLLGISATDARNALARAGVKPKSGRYKTKSPWPRRDDGAEPEPRPVVPMGPRLGPAPEPKPDEPAAPVWSLEDGRFVLDLTGPLPALRAARHAAERAVIYTALARGNGVQAEAARLLGVSRANMSKRLQTFRDEDRA